MNTCRVSCPDNFSVSSHQRLIETLGQLQAQTPNTKLGSIYIYDLVDQHTLSASCSIAAMLGYTADAIHAMGAIGLANLIHPNDLNRVSEHYQRFATLQSGEVITVNYRMKRADGTWCWLHSQETPLVVADSGFPLQILGMIQIITQKPIIYPRKRMALGKYFRHRRRTSSKTSLAKQA